MSSNRAKILIPLAILAFGVIAAVLMIKMRPSAKTRPVSEFAPLIRIVEPAAEDRVLTVRTHGTVTPRTESSVVAEVPGRIVSVAPSFADGGFFEAGEVLVTIDRRDYDFAVVLAKGAVAQARVRAELEENQALLAREEWEELGQGEGSPLAMRELQVEEAQAALAAAQASLQKAQLNLSRTEIRAPFAGRLRKKLADIGQYAAPGVPLAVIYAVDYAEVRLPIPDGELAFLDIPNDFRGGDSPGSAPAVRLSADFGGKRRAWTGRIVRMEGEIDPMSRMVHVVAQVEDPYGRKGKTGASPLSVGMFVEAEIVGREVKGAFLLPRGAIRSDGRVFVVDEESRLRYRVVEIFREERNNVIITGGLSAGDRVCISPLNVATDGMKVRTSGEERDSGPATEPAEDGS